MTTSLPHHIFEVLHRTSTAVRCRLNETTSPREDSRHADPETAWLAHLAFFGDYDFDPAHFVIVRATLDGVDERGAPCWRYDWSSTHDPQSFPTTILSERAAAKKGGAR